VKIKVRLSISVFLLFLYSCGGSTFGEPVVEVNLNFGPVDSKEFLGTQEQPLPGQGELFMCVDFIQIEIQRGQEIETITQELEPSVRSPDPKAVNITRYSFKRTDVLRGFTVGLDGSCLKLINKVSARVKKPSGAEVETQSQILMVHELAEPTLVTELNGAVAIKMSGRVPRAFRAQTPQELVDALEMNPPGNP